MKRVIVLVAHGTVENLDDLPDFLMAIRRGRPAPPELLAELRHRYEAVGGSPHLRETESQAKAVELSLGIETRTAMRLWHPTVSEVTQDLGAHDEVVLVPLAPFSVAVYERAARAELAARSDAPQLRCVAPWGHLAPLLEAQVETIERVLGGLSSSASRVVLTAHSLPTAVIAAGDSYEREFRAHADSIAKRLPCSSLVAFQSQGAAEGQWLGPTLLATLEQAKREGAKEVVVAPVGFLSEHVETLYDLDIEARTQAEALGLGWHRVPTLGSHPGLIEAISQAVIDAEAR